MEQPILISVIGATRGRVEGLKKALDSFYSKCSHPESLEFTFRIDNDDVDTISAVKTFPYPNLVTVIGDRLDGYGSLHTFSNEVCRISKGDLIFFCADDDEMLTDNWDNYLKPYLNKLCILKLQSTVDQGSYSFVVHRKVFEILGHLSLNPHCDTWLEIVGKESGIFHCIYDIGIHNVGTGGDSTGCNPIGNKWDANRSFYLPEMKEQRAEDVSKIVEYVKNYGTIIG
jgi:hypothetical protein